MRKLERKTVEWLVDKRIEWSSFASRMLTADDEQTSDMYFSKLKGNESEVQNLIEKDVFALDDDKTHGLLLARELVNAVHPYGIDKVIKCLEVCGVEVV